MSPFFVFGGHTPLWSQSQSFDVTRNLLDSSLADTNPPLFLALTVVSHGDTIECMVTQKHRNTLEAVFDDPVRSNIPWRDIEGMLKAVGAEITEGAGSRVRIALNGVRAVFHRPHPQKETDKGAVRSMRRFLTEAGVTP